MSCKSGLGISGLSTYFSTCRSLPAWEQRDGRQGRERKAKARRGKQRPKPRQPEPAQGSPSRRLRVSGTAPLLLPPKENIGGHRSKMCAETRAAPASRNPTQVNPSHPKAGKPKAVPRHDKEREAKNLWLKKNTLTIQPNTYLAQFNASQFCFLFRMVTTNVSVPTGKRRGSQSYIVAALAPQSAKCQRGRKSVVWRCGTLCP